MLLPDFCVFLLIFTKAAITISPELKLFGIKCLKSKNETGSTVNSELFPKTELLFVIY